MLLGAFTAVGTDGGTALAAPAPVVLDEGNIDFVPRVVDGRLQLQIDDRTGTAPTWREPGEVVLHVKPETVDEVTGPLVEPLMVFGELSGTPLWVLNGRDSDQRFDLDPGWSTAALPDTAARSTTVALKDTEGPGPFAMYSWDYRDDAETIEPHLVELSEEHKSFTLPDSDRFTPMWGFLGEGVYRLTFEVSTTVDGRVLTDTETVAVAVGDTDPTGVTPGDGTVPDPEPTPTASQSTSPTPTPTSRAHVIDDGHIDLATRLIDGELQFQIKDGAGASLVWREPEDVVVHARPAAKRRITPGYEFLGTVGDEIWLLPAAQVHGLVWAGWGSTELDPADFRGDLTYELTTLRGPGHVFSWQESGFGEQLDRLLKSGDGLPDSFAYPANTHSHPNWVFTKEGVYRATFTMSGTLADGRRVSDSETLAFAVGDVDPTTVTPGKGDETSPAPTASTTAPTATATPTGTTPPAPTATPTVSDAPAPGGSASASAPTSPPVDTSGAAAGGTAAGAVGGGGNGGGSSNGGGKSLASTGVGAPVLIGTAAAVTLAAGGMVFVLARRRLHKT
ncbi:choice-of-anchor M domain-containing protein [Streptomyces sp. NPDC088757]|uniref:choice-of-anchor M domain-containing protein n=1 Tax=Streptomyces sp. NPDC088757 TaxID=3365889 RepID=UPI00380BFBC3